jgi:oligopeptide transport system ATP-binding protein
MTTNEPLLDVRGLTKYFSAGRRRVIHAVEDVSFTIACGCTLGLVGESGCGKTTVCRTLAGLYRADAGQAYLNGEDILAFGKNSRKRFDLACKMQMIFQDPYASLNPFLTAGEIVAEGLEIHKLSRGRAQCAESARGLLEKVGLHKEHANRFPHEFSGGQRQRIGIARALALDPELIICDEAISALDVSVQAQIVNMLIDLREQRSLTYLFIAHDLSIVRYISDRVAVMYLGCLAEIGSVREVYGHPAHPYTAELMAAVPVADPNVERAKVHSDSAGELGEPINPGPGCRFYPRCPRAAAICLQAAPPFTPLGGDHFAACHFPG